MSKNPKKHFRVLNCIENSPIFIHRITGCVFISAFAFLACVQIGITSSATGLTMCNNCRN